MLVGLVTLVVSGVVLSCAPSAQRELPQVALINAPAEMRAAGLAEQLESLLEPQARGRYRFTFSPRVRYHETHRDMTGGRAPLQAAFTARAVGGEVAVMVGAPTYRRRVTRRWLGEHPGQRRVETEVSVRASVVDPETADILGSYDSGTYAAVRLESIAASLVDEQDDPDLARLRERALTDIVTAVADELAARVTPTAQASR